MKLLIVNSAIEKCGVFGFGWQVYRCLKESPFQVLHAKIDNSRNLFESIDFHQPTHVMFNWHRGLSVANYLDEAALFFIRARGIKIWLMPHDEEVTYDRALLDHVFWLDPTKDCAKRESVLGRPVIVPEKLSLGLNKLCTIGSAGFCFSHKKFERIKDIVGDYPCHFRFHFPVCDYGRDINYENFLKDLFSQTPGQTLEVSHDFKTQDELTYFLSENTINLFPYDESPANTNRGVSSITDNALASKRPFMISGCAQFRHLAEIDHIINYNKTDFLSCIANREKYLQVYRDKWSPENMRKIVEKAILEDLVN